MGTRKGDGEGILPGKKGAVFISVSKLLLYYLTLRNNILTYMTYSPGNVVSFFVCMKISILGLALLLM